MWGAVTALVKLHAARRGVPVVRWDHGKLYSYVVNDVEEEHREPFKRLLATADVLHRHFYENHLDRNAFKSYFNDVSRLIEEVKRAIGV